MFKLAISLILRSGAIFNLLQQIDTKIANFNCIFTLLTNTYLLIHEIKICSAACIFDIGLQ